VNASGPNSTTPCLESCPGLLVIFFPSCVKKDPHPGGDESFVPAGIFVPGALPRNSVALGSLPTLAHLDPARSRSGDVVNFLVVNYLVKEGDQTTPLCG
jgi:hypothetical protein